VSTRSLDLAATVARAQAGDQVAFDAIYHRFADTLFRYLYARCGSTELTEDLYGDVWVRVVERLPAFRFGRDDPEVVFAAWLFRIARNRVIDHYRRKGHASLPLVATLSSPVAGPEEVVIAADEHEALRRAIEQLTAEQREGRDTAILRRPEQRRRCRAHWSTRERRQGHATSGFTCPCPVSRRTPRRAAKR
jgi:RNA polymerase sigma factor (sigma-70 family)